MSHKIAMVLMLIVSTFATSKSLTEGVILHDVDIRVGHEPYPVLIRTSDCFYTAKASSITLGVIYLSPNKKVCNEIQSDVVGKPVEVKTKQLENKITGEKINTINAERIINISGWN